LSGKYCPAKLGEEGKNMNKNCMPASDRQCPHCEQNEQLEYYRESDNGNDLYWCENCYCITEWNGINKKKIAGEAYPDRKK